MLGIKKALARGATSFCYAAAINLVIGVIIMWASGKPDFVSVVPEFAAYFPSKTVAFGVQCILIGLTSMAFGAGSMIMEIASWSLVKQSIVYFIVTAAVWIPVSIVCWGLLRYQTTFFSVTFSYLIGYVISWTVQYQNCKNNIRQINERLNELNADPEK